MTTNACGTEIIMEHPSILFLNCGAICYDSTLFFEQHISDELQRRGWHTEHVTVDKRNPAAALCNYYGKHYDIIFDINTILPAATDEDQLLCLNRIEGEVYHYIIDHPFYHHDALKSPLAHFHVICLDEKHADFVRLHYPHIKQVMVLPLAASAFEPLIPYQERRHQILFTGTYSNPDIILHKAMKQAPDFVDLFQKTVALLLDSPEMTQEEAVSLLVPGHDDTLPALLQSNFLADLYLQAAIREELLKQFLLKKLPVTIYGHGWEIFAQKCLSDIPDVEKNLHLAGELPYSQMPEVYADTKISLNQTPWFKAGMHDRIPLSLLNGCVCLTEKCDYLEKQLKDRQEIYYFSLEDMEHAAALASDLLEHDSEAKAAAARGLAYAREHFCWEHWANHFLEALSFII